MDIGTPFEQWLAELAKLADQQQSPDQFFEVSINKLIRLPWFEGAAWVTKTASAEIGRASEHSTTFRVFDSVIDNLLENAYIKRRAETGIGITVTLQSEVRRVRLRVAIRVAPLLQPEPMNFLSSLYYHIVDWVSAFTKPVSKRHSLGTRLR